MVALTQNSILQAGALSEQSLALCRELRDRRGIANSLNNLGRVSWAQDDYLTARTLHQQSLTLFSELGDKQGIAVCLEQLAELHVERGQARRAAMLYGAAVALRNAIGAPISPNEHARYDQGRDATSTALGEEAFTTAWAEGQALPLDEAVALALEDTDAVRHRQ
jgi:hypothetical protein